MRNAARLLLFFAVVSRAVFGAESLAELRKEAEAGNAAAQYNLGTRCLKGDGVLKDSSEASKWFRKSAEQGNAIAQFFLGVMYDSGDGLPKDSAEAVKWYRKSAEQGNAKAQFNLGVMYKNGDGVLKDFVQAHAWYNNASANRNENAKTNLGFLEREMTPEQKAEAMKLAREIFERVEPKKSSSVDFPIVERLEPVKAAVELNLNVPQPAIDPRRSRARPMVVKQQQVRPAILADNSVGTRNMGISGMDARWSNHGFYLQKMVDAAQIQWERLILSMPTMPASGSTVSVRFVINDEGKIAQIKNVETVASETASRACVSAITDRAPYGVWTDDMKAMLGTQQEMTFTFFYQ